MTEEKVSDKVNNEDWRNKKMNRWVYDETEKWTKKKKLRNWLTDEWLNTTPITLAASIWGWRQQAQSDWRRDGEKTDE